MRTAPSAGCRRTAVRMLALHVGRPDRRSAPSSRAPAGLRRPASTRPRISVCEASRRDVLGDRPEREDAVGLRRSPATRATAAVTRPPVSGARARRTMQEHLGLALAGEPGEPDDLARVRDQPDRPRRAVLARTAAAGRRDRAPAARLRRLARRDVPIAATSESRVKARRPFGSPRRGRLASPRPGRTPTGSRRGGARSAMVDATAARPQTDARRPGSWPATTGIERRGRLVQDDQPSRHVGHGEGAGDLDQLALADGEVADHVVGLDAVAREDLVELARRSAAHARPPAAGRAGAVHDARVLGDGEVRAERQLLRRRSAGRGAGQRPARAGRSRPSPPTADRASVRLPAVPARHAISVDLPAPLCPTRPRHSPAAAGEIDPAERADGAEGRVDAGKRDGGGLAEPRSLRRATSRRSTCGRVFRRVLDIGDAAPLGGGAGRPLEIVLVDAAGTAPRGPLAPPCRRGSCWATQKARVETPGRSRPTSSRSRWRPSAPSTRRARPAVAHDDERGVGRPAALKACAAP